MKTCAILIAVLGVIYSPALADPYFGEFQSSPEGRFVNDTDRPKFVLAKDFSYTDPNGLVWTAPSGETVDGATIPQWAWSIVGGPFSGNYLRAAIIHDYYCCSKSRDYYDTHNTFWRGLRLDGIGRAKAHLMWAAVRIGGPEYWDVDPTVTPPAPCHAEGADIKIGSLLDDKSEDVRGIAATKFVALARTLKTTNGLILDVVDGEPIEAGTDRAREHLDNIYKAIEANFDFPREQLGIFSTLDNPEYEDNEVAEDEIKVYAWAPGQIPEIESYLRLTDNFSEFTPMVASSDKSYPSQVEDIQNPASWKVTLSNL